VQPKSRMLLRIACNPLGYKNKMALNR